MLKIQRSRILLPVTLAVLLVLSGLVLTEMRRSQVMQAAAGIQYSQERIRLLIELQLLMTDAESGQRGYMLTGDPSYLQPYTEAKEEINEYLRQLQLQYKDSFGASQAKATKLVQLIGAKFAEIDSTIAVYETSPKGALNVVKTNVGQLAMSDLRGLTAEMRQDERQAIVAATVEWQRNHLLNRDIAVGAALLNIVLIIVTGQLVARDRRRRITIANDLEEQVAARTAELSELSSYMQRITEIEKSALARELHDELGSLLVAIKMDLSQLARGLQLDLDNADIKPRWRRIQAALSAGIDLKRRVIEQLRPTLLDNMGLIAALRWQVTESATQANLGLAENFPREEVSISTDAAIAIFRIVQEAMTNIVKHAQATAVRVDCSVDEAFFSIVIEDNGFGLPPARLAAVGSHGLSSIRHRVRSFYGELEITAAEPSGTRVKVIIPMSRIATVGEQTS